MAHTGIRPIDEQIPGGIPQGYLVLIEGPLGVGKTFMAYSFAVSAMREGAPVAVIAVDALPEEVQEELETRGLATASLVIIDGFYAPTEKLSKMKGAGRAKLDVLDAKAVLDKLADLAQELRGGVVIIDSLNEILLRSSSVFELLRGLKIFARYANAVVVGVVHTDVEDVRNALSLSEHLADFIIQADVDPELEQMGLYVRRIRIARAKRLKVSHDWIHIDIWGGEVVEVDVRALIHALNRQLKELGIRRETGGG